MYFVGGIKARKVRNSVNEIIDLYEIKDYRASAKLKNEIPKEGEPYIEYETVGANNSMAQAPAHNPSTDINEDEIPF